MRETAEYLNLRVRWIRVQRIDDPAERGLLEFPVEQRQLLRIGLNLVPPIGGDLSFDGAQSGRMQQLAGRDLKLLLLRCGEG